MSIIEKDNMENQNMEILKEWSKEYLIL
jgi:hypothetical protein